MALPEVTIRDFLSDAVLNVNDIMSSELFGDAFLVRKLNYALQKIYSYNNRSWDVKRVDANSINATTYNLEFTPKYIFKMKTDLHSELKRSNDILSANSHYNVEANVLRFYSTIDTLKLIYRKRPKFYEVTDLWSWETQSAKLDLPLEYHGILSDLLTASLVPVWLGEWVGQLQVNFFQEAIRQLWEMKKMDSYINPLEEFDASQWH